VTSLIYRGKDYGTKLGGLMDAMCTITNREEAQEFLAAYKAIEPQYAEQNLGYLTGYLAPERARELRGWLAVVHPILGPDGPTQPTPAHLVQMGMDHANREES
jgi:hypothetical protein